MTTEVADVLVIGAGVVGLAVGRALALNGREVIVAERHRHIGEETSSRNSEVIHAGIYYPTGSLKARLCVAGRRALYAYCEARGIGHRNCGKIIVATGETQIEPLRRLARQGAANGVDDLEWADEAAVRSLEPQVHAVAGLYSPSTGIIDSHALMAALHGDIESAGGHVAPQSTFRRAELRNGRFLVTIRTVDGEVTIETAALVNCAGLHASRVAAALRGLDPQHVPVTHYAKGSYFNLRAAAPFRHLVYPIPEAAGLGIHATLDLAGRVRFGPDVHWVDDIDYAVDPARADRFYQAIRRYWPALPDGALETGHAGVRPKLAGPGEPLADFLIQGEDTHGIGGLVNLYGIESPGLTSCLAIGDRVAAQLR